MDEMSTEVEAAVAAEKLGLEELRAVLAAHRTLTANGMCVSLRSPQYRDVDREDLMNDVDGVRRAIAWLRGCQTTPRVNGWSESSYRLKHVAEKTHGYMTNGAFITACLILGVRLSFDGLNPLVGLKRPRGGWPR